MTSSRFINVGHEMLREYLKATRAGSQGISKITKERLKSAPAVTFTLLSGACTVISVGIQGEETSLAFSTSGLCRGVRSKVSALNLWGVAPLEAEWPFHWRVSDIPALGFVTVAPLQL